MVRKISIKCIFANPPFDWSVTGRLTPHCWNAHTEPPPDSSHWTLYIIKCCPQIQPRLDNGGTKQKHIH